MDFSFPVFRCASISLLVAYFIKTKYSLDASINLVFAKFKSYSHAARKHFSWKHYWIELENDFAIDLSIEQFLPPDEKISLFYELHPFRDESSEIHRLLEIKDGSVKNYAQKGIGHLV